MNTNPSHFTIYSVIGLSVMSIIASGLLFFIAQNRLIILWRFTSIKDMPIKSEKIIKKKKLIIFWHNNNWEKEEQIILMPSQETEQLIILGNTFFTTLEQHKIINKSVHLESAIINPSGQECYLSFDRYPFSKQSSIFEKWMIIQGLLRTFKENIEKKYKFYFLLKHTLMQDDHLDFSHPIFL